MNDPEESLPDEILNGMLAPLRGVSVPDDVRAANRAAIARSARSPTRSAVVAKKRGCSIAASDCRDGGHHRGVDRALGAGISSTNGR